MRRAKIVATLGPATSSISTLEELIDSGVDVFRFNFSHGTMTTHETLLHKVRKAAHRVKRYPALLQDLPGPKVRVAKLTEPLNLVKDSLISIRSGALKNPRSEFSLTIPTVLKTVKVGDPILIDDGLIRLKVIKKTATALSCQVEVGGWVKPHKGVNFPASSWETPALTPFDTRALLFGITHDIDFVALSFVAHEQSIIRAKKILAAHNSKAKVITKIERPAALDNLERILKVTDGVMVARGDLAIEVSLEKVPFLQKEITRKAHLKKVGVIIATQMLESMTEHALPTRAEVSDVANAVLDGADAMMLSAETAVGSYPLEAVQMMDRIIREAEHQEVQPETIIPHYHPSMDTIREVLSRAAVTSAVDPMHSKIVVFTLSGKTARIVSLLRPAAAIFAFTPSEKTYRQLHLEWGIQPLLMPYKKRPEEMIYEATNRLKRLKWVRHNDQLIFITGEFEKTYATHSLIIRHI